MRGNGVTLIGLWQLPYQPDSGIPPEFQSLTGDSLPGNRPNTPGRQSPPEPVRNGLRQRTWEQPAQEMIPLRTAYSTISAVFRSESFSIRFARWVSTVETPTSSAAATSLFERPSAMS